MPALTLWRKKTPDDAIYERYPRGESDEQASRRARNRVVERLLTDYVVRYPNHVRRLGTDSSDAAQYERYLRGDPNKRSALHDGNGALERLLSGYMGSHPNHIRSLADDLPTYGDVLYGIAAKEAVLMMQTADSVGEKATQYELSLSLFDFLLFAYCKEVFQFLDHDKQAALLLTDALLFQVCGQDACAVKEGDILGGRSHTRRGIEKYLLIEQMKKEHSFNPQGDPPTWLLAAEATLILCGGPDLAIECQVAARVPLMRYDASAAIRLLLYNEQPSATKRIVLKDNYEKEINKLADIIKHGQIRFQNQLMSNSVPKFVSINKNMNQLLRNGSNEDNRRC